MGSSKINRAKIESDTNFSLFGTGYFNKVWKKVCAYIFENELDLFRAFIPFPLWMDNEKNIIEKDRLIPDIISVVDGQKKAFFIIDAKYYDISIAYEPKFDFINNPGVADISKQFLYNESFSRVPFQEKYNCFLFPKLQPDFLFRFGTVSFELFKDQAVIHISADPNQVFERYLKNIKGSKSELNSIRV